MSPYRNILLESDGRHAVITLNRPEQLNPLDWATIGELRGAIASLEGDRKVRVVVVTGAGRAFSAGGDLTGYLELYKRPDDFQAFLQDFHELCSAIEASGMIFIAALNGVTVAGGLELMLTCDQVIAAEDVEIGDGHLNYAQLPGAGASQRLPRAIGALRAKQLILTGDLIPAAEAMQIGLVNEVVPGDALRSRAIELAQQLLKLSPAALKGAKHLINEGLKVDLAQGLAMEMAYVHAHATTEVDAMEGLRAFNERRPPNYKQTP